MTTAKIDDTNNYHQISATQSAWCPTGRLWKLIKVLDEESFWYLCCNDGHMAFEQVFKW